MKYVLLITGIVCLWVLVPVAAPADGSLVLSGEVSVLWADPPPGSPLRASTRLMLLRDDGSWTELRVGPGILRQTEDLMRLNGCRVRVCGMTESGPVGSRIVVRTLEVVADKRSDFKAVTGTQRFVTIMCKFADIADEPRDRAYFANMYANLYPGLDHYWREVSYDAINLAGSTAVGWFTLPHPRGYYVIDEDNSIVNLDALLRDAVTVAGGSVNFAGYNGIQLAFNAALDHKSYGSRRSLNVDGTSRTWAVTWLADWCWEMQALVCHEIGHGLGLPHSTGELAGEVGYIYDNYWDVMSFPGVCHLVDPVYLCTAPHTIALHKDMLGWLPSSTKAVVWPGQETTVNLEGLARPFGGGVKLIYIPVSGSTWHLLTVEARTADGYDANVPAPAVIIHDRKPGREEPAHIIDIDDNGDTRDEGTMWTVGETYSWNGITVSVTAATTSGYTVTVANHSPPIPEAERDALISFYTSTNGSSWTRRDNWLGNYGSEGWWYGVVVLDSRVGGLDLSANGLNGTIPAALADLTELSVVTFSNNTLTGSIPPALGDLAKLTGLDLHGNGLTGPIPAELGRLSELETLNLESNHLSGVIPGELGGLLHLTSLLLDDNDLTGTIPPAMAGAKSLEWLCLNDNRLEGAIPPELGALTGLRFLFLQNNALTGAVPPELGRLTTLKYLLLEGNRLRGSLPDELDGLDFLEPDGSGFLPGLDLRWNALYTTDPILLAFLNGRQNGADVAATQTVAPTGLAWSGPATAGRLSWTPVTYRDDAGGYEIWGGPFSGGPYRHLADVGGKSTTFADLSLSAAWSPAYVVMRTWTAPHEQNSNRVVSEFSPEVKLGPGSDPHRYLAAHVAGNDTWWSRLTLVNTGQAAGSLTLGAVGADGELGETVQWSNLEPGEAATRELEDIFSPATLTEDRWIVVGGDTELAGVVTFGTRDNQTLVTIPVADTAATDLVFPYVVSGEALGYFTGITLVNTGADGAVARLAAFTEGGVCLDQVDVEIPGGGKFVRLLDGLFAVADVSTIRFLKVRADQPLTGFELFGSYRDLGMAGLPAFEVDATGPGPYRVCYNAVPDNGTYYTGATVSNLGSAATGLTMTLYDGTGRTLVRTDWPAMVAPGEQVTRELWSLLDGVVRPDGAWLEISSPGQPVMGFELFLSRSGTEPFRFDGVIGAADGARELVFPLVMTGTEWDSRLRLTNSGTTEGTVWIRAFAATGDSLGEESLNLPARGQVDMDVETLFPSVNVAWIRVSADTAVVGDLSWVSADLTRMSAYLGLPAGEARR